MQAIEIIYAAPGSPGYHPVSYMAKLAAELLEAKLIVIRPRTFGLIEKMTTVFPRTRGSTAGVLICSQPADLASIFSRERWRERYSSLVAWVFDSFWPEYIPSHISMGKIFDHVFVTEGEDLTTWRKKMRAPVDWLPWGSDVLRLGSPNTMRSIDLLRIGRQPADWDDDLSSLQICKSVGLNFQGRPPRAVDADEGERALMRLISQAKFTLSFSNLVSPGPQTHPVRQYITGRWTDALSAGAIVAGVQPRSESVQALLWKEAMLELGTIDRKKGLAIIVEAARDWSPRQARLNYLRSLEVLDWRWRFEKLAEVLSVRSNSLAVEMEQLRIAIDHARQQFESC
jgi:hypothetical protein